MRSKPLALIGARPSRTGALPSPDELAALGIQETAEEIAEKYYRGKVSARWVLDHHCPDHKSYLGREAAWYEQHSREWMPTYYEQQRQRALKRKKAS